MTNNALSFASQATQTVAISVFLYEGFAYNFVFLGRILPAAGKMAFVIPYMLVFNAFWALSIWSYLAAHTADPGAVPKRWQEFVHSAGDALPIAPPRPEWQPGKATFCKKCDIPRPERTHHCLVCGICVLRMDHHCPWINNCVGYNNHKYFLLLGMYACITSIIALLTTIPETWSVAGAILRMQDGEDSFFQYHGYLSASPHHLESSCQPPGAVAPCLNWTTPARAQELCASLWNCAGFTFEGREGGGEIEWDRLMRVYFKDKWEFTANDRWISYRHYQIYTSDIVVFLIFGLFALFVFLLLTPMLATHLPLATQNLTTIEDNYENMPNPFDQGTSSANLAQIFGAYGPDWFLPIAPWKPLSDGVSFARSDERVGPDGLPERPMDGDEDMDVEKLWRARYHVRMQSSTITDPADDGPLSSLSRWWNGT
jgi:hypothetical protein